MDKEKQVQIPYALYSKLVAYFLLGEDSVYMDCKQGVQEKFDTLYKRHLYSKYKDKTLSAEEQEKARQEYLDLKGITKNFRWN